MQHNIVNLDKFSLVPNSLWNTVLTADNPKTNFSTTFGGRRQRNDYSVCILWTNFSTQSLLRIKSPSLHGALVPRLLTWSDRWCFVTPVSSRSSFVMTHTSPKAVGVNTPKFISSRYESFESCVSSDVCGFSWLNTQRETENTVAWLLRSVFRYYLR